MPADPFTVEVQPRFRDLDPMGHVNNAVYASYLEQARAAYYRDVLETSLMEADTVLASVSVDFRDPIEFGDIVTVALDVVDVGDSSILMEYELRVDGTVVASAETVQVVFDRDTGEPRSVPDDWRYRIEEFDGSSASHR